MKPFPLFSILRTSTRPTSPVLRDVGPAVRLLVEPDDLDDTDPVHRRRHEGHLGADQLLVEHRLVTGDVADDDRPVGFELAVDRGLDARPELGRHRVELEVHPCRERLHVASRHRHTIEVPDHPAEAVQRRVGAHVAVAAVPVDRTPDRGPRLRRRLAVGELVPDLVAVLDDVDHVQVPDRPGVVRLAAAGRIERGPVEGDPAPVDSGHDRLELGQVGVVEAEEIGQVAPFAAAASSPRARRRKSSSSRRRFSATTSSGVMCVTPESGITVCGLPAASSADESRSVLATATLSSARPWMSRSGRTRRWASERSEPGS